MGVGVGEAGGVAPAYSLIADYFPPRERARALAIYSFGIPLGSALAMVFGGLIASLPLVSVLGMIWLWRDTRDPVRMAAHATGTFWFVLPSLPMFLLIPALLKRGLGFWPALAAGCILTIVLYSAMVWLGPKVGLKL